MSTIYCQQNNLLKTKAGIKLRRMERKFFLIHVFSSCILMNATLPDQTEKMFCPENCTCNWKSVSASCKFISTVPNFKENSDILLKLDLSDNLFTHIDQTMFDEFSALQNLILSNNSIINLPKETFKNLSHIRTLSLDHNKLTNFNFNAFTYHGHLIILDLSFNFLTTINLSIFDSMPILTNLNLAHNNLITIHIEPFLPKSLVAINLEHNKLINIPSNLCTDGSHLKQVYLNHNHIALVQNFSFAKCFSLHELYLHSNLISNVENFSFLPLKNISIVSSIQTLILNKNHLIIFPRHLKGLGLLQTLDISENPIISFQKGDFDGFGQVTHFKASYMPVLSKIEKETFQPLTMVKQIDLCCNHMVTSLYETTFERLNYLEHLILANNSIKTFQKNLLNWNHLHFVDIRNNPLHCVCNQSWMQTEHSWATNISWAMAKEVTCTSPKQVTGRKLVSLTLMELGCQKSYDARLQTAAIFAVICFVFLVIVFVIAKYRRSVLLRWKYFKYARHSDDSTYTIDKEMEEYTPRDKHFQTNKML